MNACSVPCLLFLLVVCGVSAAQEPQTASKTTTGTVAKSAAEQPRGTRVAVSLGQLFIPEGYAPAEGKVHVLLHLKGVPTLVESQAKSAGLDAVVVSIANNGLSAVYREMFAKPDVLTKLLDEVLDQSRKQRIADSPTIGRLTISSWSAGFGAVRELLKSEAHFQRIDTLVMADSIYCGYVGDPAKREVDPQLMEGFLRFARAAEEGKKTMVISYCQLQPDGYASTGETAEYLSTQLGLTRRDVGKDWAEGFRCLSRADKNGLHILSFAGDTGVDHTRHLRNLGLLLREGK